ncbi:MAG TPA: indole-3-glycerol phosphate synthase TrpC [Candidatus Hydrogenedentes bacterium]|nr:indole-3-glycerol phosphate synthase TrpC [Candidatus Hydrogenedentota bacterium]HPG66660.1 indole-3-glycerol phosphate synthase TrpC [Candidatus Hydrogenedentota bacterium]
MILDDICAHKREEVERRKGETPQSVLEDRIRDMRPARNFRQALREEGLSLVAEIKRASPSKGVMLENTDPVELAAVYESSGARAISILTDEVFFKGTLEDLTTVRQNVALPCLRKDFVIDPYQIYEARAAHADAVLLIVRILSDGELRAFLDLTRSLEMHALVETRSEDEIRKALDCGAHIVGINNRDLSTFKVDIRTTLELKRYVPGGVALVSESGIMTGEDARLLEDGGVDAILVGEALVTSKDIRAKIRELIARQP